MTRTILGPDDNPGKAPPARTARSRITKVERMIVLGGFAAAAAWTVIALLAGVGTAAIGALWLAAIAWTIVTSLALALRRGLRHGDWSAFRRRGLPDGRDERIDAATGSGQYAHLSVAEEHERMMRD